jgi:hypothetical protein
VPPIRVELGEQLGIIGRIGDDRDEGVVLGRRADHRRAADVDILDDLVAVGALASRSLRTGRG